MLRAALKQVTGTKDRVDVMVGRGGIARLPDPAALRIIKDGAGFALLRIDAFGASISHTWHATIDDAKAHASSGYGIATDEWEPEP
jgi:hypothetical protein